MVRIYVGSLGAGKSYGMVEDAFELHKDGWYVMSNSPVVFADLVSFDDVFKLVVGERSTYRVVVLLDEAGIDFFARLYRQNAEQVASFFLLRKHGFHLFMTAQYFEQVDKAIRQLIDEVVVCIKLLGRFYVRIYADPAAGVFKSYVKFGVFSKRVFDMYDTLWGVSGAKNVLDILQSNKCFYDTVYVSVPYVLFCVKRGLKLVDSLLFFRCGEV